MNSESTKMSDPHRLLLNLSDKINLKRSDKYVALSNLSIYYTWKNIKKSYKNNKFTISVPTWNEEFELTDGLYSVSDIQDYFKYVLKKHETVIDNPSIMIYVNKIENKLRLKELRNYNLKLFWSPQNRRKHNGHFKLLVFQAYLHFVTSKLLST